MLENGYGTIGTKSKVGTLYNFKAGLDTKEENMEMITITTQRDLKSFKVHTNHLAIRKTNFIPW